MLSDCLQARGFDVTIATTGKDALKLLENHYFDLVVADVVMPGADGLEVIAAAKRRYASTRIMVIYGGGHALDANYCLDVARKMGAHAALRKPFTALEFSDALRIAIPPANTSAPF
jgi:CheY-like chemotaxis protein